MNILARIWKLDVECFCSTTSALGWDVKDGHVWKRIESILSTRSTRDADWGTVHVDFAVSNLVVPSPSKRIVTGRNFFWDLEVV